MASKTGPARMLSEIATIVTNEAKRVWLTKLKQKGGNELVLSGGAMDHEDISEFQLALERREMFANVQLKKITTQNKKGTVPYLTWELVCKTSFKL